MKRLLLIFSFCLAAQYSRQSFAQSLLPPGDDSPPISDDSEVFSLQLAQSGLLAVPETDGFAKTPPGGPHLTYLGGPILSNVKVVTIFWGPVRNPDRFNALYQMLTVSPIMAWLSEYNTPTQQVGFGSLVASDVDTDAPVLPTIHDDQIQAELMRLINSGRIPAGDDNTLFAFHFAEGQDVETQGVHGCARFLGYHTEFKVGQRTIPYSVIVDCGFGEDFTGKVAEHELIESVTDPRVFTARAWVDTGSGQEISDICSNNFDVQSGFVVQQNWSNQAGKCITTKLPPPANDFSFTTGFVQGRRTIPGEVNVSLPVATSITNGVAQDITLSVIKLPEGMTAVFDPPVVRAGDTATMRLTVAPNASITPFTFGLVIVGSGSSVTHAAESTTLIVPSLELITNGGFESDFDGWAGGGDQPPILENHPFDGKFSLTLGSTSVGAGTESFIFAFPNSSAAIRLPAGQIRSTLSFWNQPATTGVAPDSFQEAVVLDTTGNVLQTIFHQAANHDWDRQTVDLSAFNGQTIKIRFKTHNGSPTTATSMRLDDVSLAITPN